MLKRSPIQRKKYLPRNTKPLKRSWIKRTVTAFIRRSPLAKSPKMLARRPVNRKSRKQILRDAAWAAVKRVVFAKYHGWCGAHCSPDCTHVAVHGHHLLPRGRGGNDVESNCLPTCQPCHDFIHQNPARAVAMGLLKHSYEGESNVSAA